MPFLALDAGNSSVKAAIWDGAWRPMARFPSDDATAAAWIERLADLGRGCGAGGLASVVPSVTPALAEALAAVTGRPPVVVSPALALPFRLAYATPQTLGADRLAAAVAAHALAGDRAVIALDAGTTVTTEVVTASAAGEPAYLGGAILPGPDLLRRALVRDTRQLPDVPWPETVAPVGESSVGAIQAGLGVLVVDGVAGLLRRTQAALGGGALVVATGGWADWLAARIPEIDRVEPFLVLDGVRRLAAVDGVASGP